MRSRITGRIQKCFSSFSWNSQWIKPGSWRTSTSMFLALEITRIKDNSIDNRVEFAVDKCWCLVLAEVCALLSASPVSSRYSLWLSSLSPVTTRWTQTPRNSSDDQRWQAFCFFILIPDIMSLKMKGSKAKPQGTNFAFNCILFYGCTCKSMNALSVWRDICFYTRYQFCLLIWDWRTCVCVEIESFTSY